LNPLAEVGAIMSFRTSTLSLVALALAAPVLYQYGPSFIKRHETKVLEKVTPSRATASSDAVQASLDAVKETVKVTGPTTSAGTAKPQSPPFKSKNTIKKRSQSAHQPIKVNALSGQPLPEAPALKPAEKDTYVQDAKKHPTMSPQERQFMGKDRNFSDPMKDRWVNDVSGPNAQVAFEKFRHAENCQLAGTCEREDAPKDVNLAGVVVDSDQLRRPADSMLDGRLKRGHYVKKTPAVYLK